MVLIYRAFRIECRAFLDLLGPVLLAHFVGVSWDKAEYGNVIAYRMVKCLAIIHIG